MCSVPVIIITLIVSFVVYIWVQLIYSFSNPSVHISGGQEE